MSSLFFELDIFCLFDAGVPEFDVVFTLSQLLQYFKGEDPWLICKTPVSNRQKSASSNTMTTSKNSAPLSRKLTSRIHTLKNSIFLGL
jgi:hypothetical protein